MKVYVFNFDNYYAGSRTFKVFAHSEAEAYELLKKEYSKYLNDETELVSKHIVELDSPKVIK